MKIAFLLLSIGLKLSALLHIYVEDYNICSPLAYNRNLSVNHAKHYNRQVVKMNDEHSSIFNSNKSPSGRELRVLSLFNEIIGVSMRTTSLSKLYTGPLLEFSAWYKVNIGGRAYCIQIVVQMELFESLFQCFECSLRSSKLTSWQKFHFGYR